MSQSPDKLEKFVTLLKRHASQEGIHMTCNANFGTMRVSSPEQRAPRIHQAALIVVGQGKKRCYVGDKLFEYGKGDFMVLFLPMPLETEIVEASPDCPFLATGIKIDLGRLADVLMRIERAEGGPSKPFSQNPSGIFSAPIPDSLLDPLMRLFESLENPRDAEILGEMILDEIYYRILCDERGRDLRTYLQQNGQVHQISKVVQHLQQNIDEPVSVQNLARLVHMSRTRFYETFTNLMHVSPLQYAKAMKLIRAQTLIKEGKNVSEAGYLVGYKSPAQFSREYKRHFGCVPSVQK